MTMLGVPLKLLYMWLNVAGISIGSILLVGGIAFLIVYLTVLNPVG